MMLSCFDKSTYETPGSGTPRKPPSQATYDYTTEAWPDIRLPAGTAADLIDADRGEA